MTDHIKNDCSGYGGGSKQKRGRPLGIPRFDLRDCASASPEPRAPTCGQRLTAAACCAALPGRAPSSCRGPGSGDRLRRRFLQHVLAVELGHPLVLAAPAFFASARARSFSSRAVLAMPFSSRSVCLPLATASAIELQACARSSSSVDLLAAGEDLVTAVLLVPLGERGRHVHLLDDVPPADARVVGAEADLAFLRRVRNDAALGAAEVVVEQVLEPHAGDEQEVPAVRAALLDVRHRAVAGDLAVVLARSRRTSCRTSSSGRSA